MKKRSVFTLRQMRFALGLVGVMFFALCVSAEAQQPKKAARISLLTGGRGFGSAGDAFRQALRKLGWTENQNMTIDSHLAEMDLDQLPKLAADLARAKVAVIVADGEPAIQAAKRATATIPIVVIAVGDPVREGLVASLARPGGNITGLTSVSADVGGKRLELLKETSPKVRAIAVLWNPSNPSNVLELKEMEVAARALALNLQPVAVRAPDDFPRAFADAARERANALAVVRDPLIDSYHFHILDFAIDKQLPFIYGERQFVEAGGLMSYGPSREELFRRAATYVDKILKGSKPADLPVEQPTKFELVINLKTAKQIGLAIPQSILYRADKVIR